jgi:hypothetical protein
MNRFQVVCIAVFALFTMPVWSQVETASQPGNAAQQDSPAQPGSATPSSEQSFDHPEDRMQAPPPVTGQNYATAFTSEERANYLRYGVVFTPAYTDNALAGTGSHLVSDVSYSVAPTVAIDESTSRVHWVATYAPGFTFYQRLSARNEADENAALNFSYRLSPHVTFSAQDAFQKSSNVFNQPDLGSAGTVSGGMMVPNFSILTPIAERLSNSANASLTYQFALNGMVGASGTFTNLHYPNPSEVPGLYDSASQGGSAFYSLRISKMHYLGATYQYQRLVSYPTEGLNETQTHAVMLFYTLYPSSHFSMSFFGGPQYSNTVEPPVPPLNIGIPSAKAWTPAAGASVNWQGRLTSFAISYSHVISGAGGLIGAVHLDSGTGTIRQQLTKSLTASIGGGYAENKVIGSFAPSGYDGHSINGTASLQQQFGQHLDVQLGYTRLHQDYGSIPVISSFPDTNREFISIAYQFSRALGR